MVFGTFLDSFFRDRSSACSTGIHPPMAGSRRVDLRPSQNGATFKKRNSREGNSPCLVPGTHLIIQPQLKNDRETALVYKKGCKGALQASNQAWYRRQPEYQGASSWKGGGAPKTGMSSFHGMPTMTTHHHAQSHTTTTEVTPECSMDITKHGGKGMAQKNGGKGGQEGLAPDASQYFLPSTKWRQDVHPPLGRPTIKERH